ncbi:MAG: histidine phosphatase family protein [Azonexus sp.]|jgi:probable phosphoglycerate mutase|nr:histidine phosphatase family protein [Azonexus sp.]
MSVTCLCLVRHGETGWNIEKRIQGQIDIALNANGVKQAEAAGRWLAKADMEALYSSDLGRAWQTAEAIGRATGLPPQAEAALRERRYGVFEGLTHDEAKLKDPAGHAALVARDPDYALGNGESLKMLLARVSGVMQRLVERHPGGRIIAVTHGGVIDIVNRLIRGNPLETPRDFLIPNTGFNWLVCRDGAWAIEVWGDTSHLAPGVLDELPS